MSTLDSYLNLQSSLLLSDSDHSDHTEKPAALPKRPKSKKAAKRVEPKPAQRRDREESPVGRKGARLVDLCAQDKSKIGELVKKLTSETRLRQDSEQRFD